MLPDFSKTIVILCFLGACQTPETAQNQPQQTWLDSLDLSLEEAVLVEKLDSANIGAEEIYAHCQKLVGWEAKTKLIEAFYKTVPNYLQEENPGYWLAVLYDVKKFAELLSVFKQDQHRSFVDVGSGNGEKPFAALCLGFDKAYGIEYAPQLVGISQKSLAGLIEKDQIEILGQDALKVEASFYQSIDFIYLYSPIKDHEVMASLFWKIMQSMKEGDILAEVRMVYNQELAQISGLAIPELSNLILKKEGDQWFYARYSKHKVQWTQLKSKNLP